jgi:indole-3-glycerol phosphate synthase
VGFLETVVEQKRIEVASKSAVRPIAELEREVGNVPLRDFTAAVSGERRVIAELKARTPTAASFRHSGALHELARTYEACGAAAISVVTDRYHFGTSLEDVRRVRGAVELPVLVKDFILDPYQLLEARAYGADAVLLIVRMLHWDALTALLDLSRELGMAALVETHDEKEMKTALQARSSIVGVNNRDLDSMAVSLDTTRRLAQLVPEGVILVAESGIRRRADLDDLAAHGAGAFLVGSSLLDAEDPEALLRSLTGGHQ